MRGVREFFVDCFRETVSCGPFVWLLAGSVRQNRDYLRKSFALTASEYKMEDFPG